MLRIGNIKLTPSGKLRFDKKNDITEKALEEALKAEAAKKLKTDQKRIRAIKVVKQSIDARKKEDVKVVFTLDVKTEGEERILKACRDKDVIRISEENPEETGIWKKDNTANRKDPDIQNTRNTENFEKKRVVVAGFGPAGFMCALKLAEAGMEPIVIERGENVEKRLKTVRDFWQGGKLNPSSNVQFGEGGAGTFSDGKLNTMVKDTDGRLGEVYRTFVKFGADSSILYVNKPHIGTDKLAGIVKAIRERIRELGGKVFFSVELNDIRIDESGSLREISLSDGTELECDALVLAIGHSARDTFEMLKKKNIAMEKKPFAMGVRVQHPRDYIDRLQYGSFHEFLPAADYKLVYSVPGTRSAYSFCMCPGGYVVNASSEEHRLAVNGMSYSSRNGSASNSALVVQVNTSDFPQGDCLAGMKLQRELEEKAYTVKGGKIPVQYLSDFYEKSRFKIENAVEKGRFFKENGPECKGNWAYADLNLYLPDFISETLIKAFPRFGQMMRGFNSENALLLGLESRTSSPVRILRGEDGQSLNVKGLYPCGEGAGYAGGIASAAMDGIKVAKDIIDAASR